MATHERPEMLLYKNGLGIRSWSLPHFPLIFDMQTGSPVDHQSGTKNFHFQYNLKI